MIANFLTWLKVQLWAKRLASTGYFDARWYLSRNPDVEEANLDPIKHYLQYGAFEGRDPHPAFLSSWYLHKYPDVAESQYPPLVHYVLKGEGKGYRPHPRYAAVGDYRKTDAFVRPASRTGFDPEKKLRIGFVVTDDSSKTMAGDYFTAMELAEALQDGFGWETRFLPRTDKRRNWFDASGLDCMIVMLDDYDLHRIYGAHADLITIAWMRNWFDRWVSRPWIADYSLHLCTSERAKRFVKSKSGIDSNILRLATSPRRFNQQIKPVEKFICDYCFTGNYWGFPREIEKFTPDQLPYRFAVFGDGWCKSINLAPHSRGSVPYDQMNAVYASTKLLIDDANIATIQWGSVNSRVFDAIASGVLVISNGNFGSAETFDNLLPVYDSAGSLKQQVSHFLANDSERWALVKRLQDLVLIKHTYERRAWQLVAIIGRSCDSLQSRK